MSISQIQQKIEKANKKIEAEKQLKRKLTRKIDDIAYDLNVAIKHIQDPPKLKVCAPFTKRFLCRIRGQGIAILQTHLKCIFGRMFLRAGAI